jgi:hypothetical protein
MYAVAANLEHAKQTGLKPGNESNTSRKDDVINGIGIK